MMSENDDIDQKTAKKSDESTVHPPTTTGGNNSSNGNGQAGNHTVDVNKANDKAATTNGSDERITDQNVVNGKTATTTTTNLHNRSSTTQSNWVQFESDESPTDIKVILNRFQRHSAFSHKVKLFFYFNSFPFAT